MLVTTTLENFRQLGESEIAVVRVFNGELPLPTDLVDVEKQLRFLLAFSDEDFDRCPVAWRLRVEPTVSSLREILPNVYKGKW